jgi:hypothetical protein
MKNIVIGFLLCAACVLTMGLTAPVVTSVVPISALLETIKQPERHVGGGYGAPAISYSGTDSSYRIPYGLGVGLELEGIAKASPDTGELVIVHLRGDATGRCPVRLFCGNQVGKSIDKIFKTGTTADSTKIIVYHLKDKE